MSQEIHSTPEKCPSCYSTMPPDQLAKYALLLAEEMAEKDDRLLTLLFAIRDQIEIASAENEACDAKAALNLTEILVDLMGDATESLMLRGMLKDIHGKLNEAAN